MPTVRIPAPLRGFTGGSATVTAPGSTVGEVLHRLVAERPGLAERLLDADGVLRRYVNVFVDDDDVRLLDGLDTGVAETQVVSIVPAVAGG